MDVFISYSSKDRPLVKNMCDYLEKKGVSCFYDSRNIPKGKDWRSVLVEAIEKCKLFVVVFTEEYNIATATDTELGIANESQKPVLIYRIADESIPYKGLKKWCLHGKQWVNAIGKTSAKFEKLYNCVLDNLHNDEITIVIEKEKLLTVQVGAIELNMVKVEGGSFRMGISEGYARYAQKDEMPVHHVTLDTFFISETPVTQELWESIMGDNPSQFRGTKLPVENVTWDKCQNFIKELNNKMPGKHFRLPTEAEWEFAARGGIKSKNYLYSGDSDSNNVSWTQENSENKTHVVKTKAPNELGLYDISGNVNEWCQDWYAPYDKKNQKNPQGPSSGVCRVTRGGSWNVEAKCCRVSYRDYCSPVNHYSDLGFRLVLDYVDI